MRHRTVPDPKTKPSASADSSDVATALTALSYETPDPKRQKRYGSVARLLILLLIGITALFVTDAIMQNLPLRGRSEQAIFAPARSDVLSLREALSSFDVDTGRYPSTTDGLQALLTAPSGIANWHGPYLLHPPKDPWGNLYSYHYTTKTGVEIRCAGHDGKLGTSDDIADAFNPPKSP